MEVAFSPLDNSLEALRGPHSHLPTYAEELAILQRRALSRACLLGAPLLLAFSAIDRLLAPTEWVGLLAARATAAFALLFLSGHLRRPGASAFAWTVLALGGTIGVIEVAVLATGNWHSPYLYAMAIPLALLGLLIPFTPRQIGFLHAQTIATALLPLMALGVDLGVLAVMGPFLLCSSAISIVVAWEQDGLRRREFLARTEAARRAGLMNLGTLAGGLAHELANPLTQISMEADLLASRYCLDERAQKTVTSLQSGIGRLARILEAMRHGARLADDELRPIDLANELEITLTLLSPQLRGVEVRRDFSRGIRVNGQPTLLGQVFMNLLLNAIQATAELTKSQVMIRLVSEHGCAILEIEDNGRGVPPALQQQIFEPLYSTKGSEGSGFGLWISKEIARSHGGKLTVSNAPSGGARFRLTLPIAA